MVEHFTSIIPCHFSLISNSKPDPCRLVLDITKTEAQITIYYCFGETKSAEFNYKEYNAIILDSYGCTFVNNQDYDKNAYFYFFNNDNDFRRFIFILTESGMIIPHITDQNNSTNQQQFSFLHKHSFVPEGKYNFVFPSIIINIKKILKNLVKKIKVNECIPFNKDYYRLVFPFLHKIEERKIKNLKINNKSKISDSIPSPNQTTLIKKMITRSGYDKNEYKKLQKEMLKNQENEKYSKSFQMIKSDSREMNNILTNEFLSSIYQEKWSKQLNSICLNICKVYTVSQKVEYNKNNFFIAMKIALLLSGGDRIINFVDCLFASNSKSDMNSIANSIPSYVKKNSENEVDFEGLAYSLYSMVMKPLTVNISELLKNSYVYFMTMLENLIPYSNAYFALQKVDSFEWLGKDVKELFLFTFKSPWIVWFFIMRTNDPDLAVESIIASIAYFLVPRLVEQKIEGKKAIEDYWPNFVQCLLNDAELVKDVVDTATCFYFYQKAEVVEQSLL